ncbi:helix-turn-helix domain-containing protein [Robertmurraya massiliosenegalensis]|uniref:PucR family transcriptional regulator n=1 Tax=Robertmurraya TaxID=2837507 RepID=UPI0039A6815C
MKGSIQHILLTTPMHHLSFFTSLPREELRYEKILEYIPVQWLQAPTLLMLKDMEEWDKINKRNIRERLLQDAHLVGIVLCSREKIIIQEETIQLFEECQLPVIQVFEDNVSPLTGFHTPYSQLSLDLKGYEEKGFIHLATELSKGLNTPLLYLNEKNQITWQTGRKEVLQEANRWLNTRRTKVNDGDIFTPYYIHLSESSRQMLIASSELTMWQRQMIDRLAGLTALYIQKESRYIELQEKMKEHFIYDILYHKFESKKEMIKQGKVWGWNLERPHDLLVINITFSDPNLSETDCLDEIVNDLHTFDNQFIPFQFQEQLIILVEDQERLPINEKKTAIVKKVELLHKELSRKWSQFQFTIGIGKWYEDTIHLNKSYQEAKLALKFGQRWFEDKFIFHIRDLGILHLLIHLHHELLFDFSQEYLSELIDADVSNGTEYIKTLQVYIQHEGKITEASDALFIHPNTLRNRIKKIEEITGTHLQDPEEYMNLTIATRILSFLNL